MPLPYFPMTIFRRFLVLLLLFFWQGGFLFYSCVAVPIGRQELGPRSAQTKITTRVTKYVNLVGVLALVPLLWDVCVPDPSARRRRIRFGLWGVLVATLLAQEYLHYQIEGMVTAILSGNDPPSFPLQHWLYLGVSAVQLLASLIYLALALKAWQARDRLAACGKGT